MNKLDTLLEKSHDSKPLSTKDLQFIAYRKF